MKDSLLVPVRYIFRAVLFFGCIGLAVFLLPALKFPGRALSFGGCFSILAERGHVIGFLSLFFALVVSHFSIIRRPGIKVLSLFLLFASAYFSLYLGLYGFTKIRHDVRGGTVLMPLSEDRLHRSEDAYLWIGEGGSMPAETILVWDRRGGAGGFQVYPEGIHNPEKETLRLLSSGREIRLAVPESSDTPVFLRAFILDLAYIAETALPKRLYDPKSAIFVFALVFFGFSLWTLARLTRWPLFNVWIVFGAVWLVFAGIRFAGVTLLPELAIIGGAGWAADYLPAALPAVCGLIFFLGGLLLKPLGEWKRDLRYE